MANKIFDSLILGRGPAGVTASIYLARAGKSVALTGTNIGGNIAKSFRIENIPGFACISGQEFSENLQKQIDNNKEFIDEFYDDVVLLKFDHGLFYAWLSDNTLIVSKTILFATGTTPKRLPFETNNQHFCVACDGPFYKNKDVVVVGGGNTGVTYALELSEYCKSVHLIETLPALKCDKQLFDKLNAQTKITTITGVGIKGVTNNKSGDLTSVELNNGQSIKCKAIFTAIGFTPNTEIARQFATFDNGGYIIAENCISQRVPGVFAAGDCRQNGAKQVTVACADGTIAALNIIKYLNK